MREGSSVGLLELQEGIRGLLETGLERSYWVRAEISDIKQQSVGHCYLELVERREDDEGVSARAQAIIWASSFRMIRPYFYSSTGSELSRGMQILVRAQVQYSPLYGLSLIISDIDPSYTVGEQELQRQKTIKRLKEEGMFEMNSTIELTALPSRIAVISSESAAGFRDFMNHLHKNEYGFCFNTELFKSSMQGASAPGEIISALDQIAKRCDEFDMVVIIRGGGSVQDLSCFDDYELSANIAQFPLPVITGIGHDHDVHIADLVAWRGLKTPTAVADFIIEMFSAEEQQLAYLLQRLSMAIRERGAEELSALEKLEMKIYSGAKERLASEIYRVDLLSQKAESGNPLTLLRRGYAVPVVKGERINSVDGIEEGGMIKIIMADGEVECKIEKIKRYEDKG